MCAQGNVLPVIQDKWTFYHNSVITKLHYIKLNNFL